MKIATILRYTTPFNPLYLLPFPSLSCLLLTTSSSTSIIMHNARTLYSITSNHSLSPLFALSLHYPPPLILRISISLSELTFTSHMVHVVSILQVPTIDGSVSFQSKHVNGAQYSVCVLCVVVLISVSVFVCVRDVLELFV
jgi:hypothetical protein